MGWWTNIWKQNAEHWTYAPLNPNLVPNQVTHDEIQAEKAYISIFLRSMRVVNVRKGLSKFYGAVHSYISLSHLSQTTPVQFHHLTTPSYLKDVDAAHIDRVITVNQRLLGPIPYRGGDVEVELGLFSIKSVDLAGPFLSVLEDLAKAAGVSFVNVARPFVSPLLQGLNLLVGAQGNAILEVGLDRAFDRVQTGYFLIMRAPVDTISIANLKVHENDYRLVDTTGRALDDSPYMVISIEASQQRDDWFMIPELAATYRDLQSDFERGRVQVFKESQLVFNRTARTCPDLLKDDAERIVKLVDDEVKKNFGTEQTAAKRFTLPDLRDIKLYG